MYTTYYPTGQYYIVEYRVDGIRKGEVLIYDVKGQEINNIMYITNGQICIIEYVQNNKLHNLHGPADIRWHYDGQIKYIKYRQNGLLHNLHEPARIEWYDNGQINHIIYYQNGQHHKLHGPAYINWYNGKINYIEYIYFNKLIKKYKF